MRQDDKNENGCILQITHLVLSIFFIFIKNRSRSRKMHNPDARFNCTGEKTHINISLLEQDFTLFLFLCG